MTANPIKPNYHRFTTSDGVELSYTAWSRAQDSDYRNLVLVLHGVGFHSEPYSVIPENVNLPGTLFAGLDYRGHGRSGGARGTLGSPARMLRDIHEWICQLEAAYPGAQKFLVGESMSGPYATLYAAQNPSILSGLLLIAPAAIVSWRQIVHCDTLKALVSIVRSPSSPSVDLAGWRLAVGSDSSGFVGNRRSDPLAVNKVSSLYVMRISQAIGQVFLRKSLNIAAPVLIIHGGKDNINSPFGSRLLFRKIKSPDKRLAIIPQAHHTLLWDASSQGDVFKLMQEYGFLFAQTASEVAFNSQRASI